MLHDKRKERVNLDGSTCNDDIQKEKDLTRRPTDPADFWSSCHNQIQGGGRNMIKKGDSGTKN